ncbi:MAG TPA: ATP-binding cassette domain-containing protein, partial [Candidatus Stercoripulliclostridium merdipullorum]|nr:ATP-binding cassette domain-containing protein [Candidatus Stercoripulliclostridium merdipullorum]
MKLLEVKNVSHAYESRPVIEGVSFDVNEGETVCLIGTSGVGKTTLFQVLSGLVKPLGGEVL